MAKRLGKMERVRRFIQKHPNATTEQIVQALEAHGVSKQTVYQVRNLIKTESSSQTPRVRKRTADPIQIQIDVPAEGINLKLAGNGQGMLGTLVITRSGMAIIKPNAKKPSRQISWTRLQTLAESGLLQD